VRFFPRLFVHTSLALIWSPSPAYSYTYDITQTLQKNFTRAVEAETQQSSDGEDALPRWNDKFVWNHKLLIPMMQHLKSNSPWILPMIYGSIEQASASMFPHDPYLESG